MLTLWTAGTFLARLLHGFLPLTLLPASLVALSGWLTAAWRLERAWAWYVGAILAALRLESVFLALLDGDLPFLLWVWPHSTPCCWFTCSVLTAVPASIRRWPRQRGREPQCDGARSKLATDHTLTRRGRIDQPSDTDVVAAGRDRAGPP